MYMKIRQKALPTSLFLLGNITTSRKTKCLLACSLEAKAPCNVVARCKTDIVFLFSFEQDFEFVIP